MHTSSLTSLPAPVAVLPTVLETDESGPINQGLRVSKDSSTQSKAESVKEQSSLQLLCAAATADDACSSSNVFASTFEHQKSGSLDYTSFEQALADVKRAAGWTRHTSASSTSAVQQLDTPFQINIQSTASADECDSMLMEHQRVSNACMPSLSRGLASSMSQQSRLSTSDSYSGGTRGIGLCNQDNSADLSRSISSALSLADQISSSSSMCGSIISGVSALSRSSSSTPGTSPWPISRSVSTYSTDSRSPGIRVGTCDSPCPSTIYECSDSPQEASPQPLCISTASTAPQQGVKADWLDTCLPTQRLHLLKGSSSGGGMPVQFSVSPQPDGRKLRSSVSTMSSNSTTSSNGSTSSSVKVLCVKDLKPLNRNLGKGSSGVVRLMKHEPTNTVYALKV